MSESPPRPASAETTNSEAKLILPPAAPTVSEIAENSQVEKESKVPNVDVEQSRNRFRPGSGDSAASTNSPAGIKGALRRFVGPTESSGAANLAQETTLPHEIQIYEKDRTHFFIGLHILNALTVLTLGIICYLLVKFLDGFSLQPDQAELSDYNVHLVCNAIGFVIAPVYAVLLYRIYPSVKYSRLTTIHVIFLMFTSFLAIYGVKIAYESHHVYGRVHLYSLHGWLGVILTVLLFFCIVSGNWIYLSATQLPFMVSCHKIIGMTLIGLSTGASISGILTRSQHLVRRFRLTHDSEDKLPDRVIILNSLGILITVFVILARWLLTEDRFRRRPHPATKNDDDAVTGLLRYLATGDDSVLIPDEKRAWTEFVDESEEEDEEKAKENPVVMPSDPVQGSLSILDTVSSSSRTRVPRNPVHLVPAVLDTLTDSSLPDKS